MSTANDIYFARLSNEKLRQMAIEEADLLAEENPDTIKLHALSGRANIQAGNYGRAIDYFDHIIEDFPYTYHARLARGITSILTNKLMHALNDFDFLLEFDNEDIFAHYYRGYIYLIAGCYNDALEDFNHINNEASEKKLYCLDLYRCICSYNLRTYDSALISITSFIASGQEAIEHYFLRGLIYLELDKYEDCIEDMDYVLEADCKNEDALYARFVAHRALGLNAEANIDILALLDKKLYYIGEELLDENYIDESLPVPQDRFTLN